MSKAKWPDRTLIESKQYLALCTTEKAFKREMKRLKVKNPGSWINDGADATTNYFTQDNKNCAIVCIRAKGVEKRQVYALLVHEAVHIWQIEKEIIEEFAPSKEFEAYAIQSIALNLFYAYDENLR